MTMNTAALMPISPMRNQADIDAYVAQAPLADRLPGRSVYDVFEASAKRDPSRNAITMVMTAAPDEQPRQVNYGTLLAMIRKAANLFASMAGRGAGVAYMLPSLPETHAVLWGAETAGYAVPINFLLQTEAIAALLRASDAKLLVALGPHPALDIWQKALALREQLPDLQLIRVGGGNVPLEPGVTDLGAAFAAHPGDRLTFGKPRGGDDVAAYFHTGGTTGTPKLVAHTHAGQLAAALGGAVLMDIRPTDHFSASLPLFHVGGTIACALSPFMVGCDLVILSPSGFRNPAMVQNIWRLVERYRLGAAGGVPTAVAAFLDVPVGDADISSIRCGYSGAASAPLAVVERFKQVTGRNFYEIYGMTEASGLVAIDPIGGTGVAGSVGFPLPYTEIEIRHPGGERCAQGQVGVVMVRGPHISSGYRDAAHSVGIFVDGGWLVSGDLGYFDDTGRLHLAGRSKDLIIRSGHNIDPQMIENVMTEHPAVAVAAAVGMPDSYAGELPVCYVSLRPGANATEADLQEHARASIAERPAWPRRIHILDAIPMTAVGKIYKPTLRCDAARRTVEQMLVDPLDVPGAVVTAMEGGKRGMTITVTLPASAAGACVKVTEALSPYLFEVNVEVADAG
ncbi:MAG: AMP-binding protein [Burkholderiales bacterium]|nr:AMP-binding protein [Burkholderiales bacterium]